MCLHRERISNLSDFTEGPQQFSEIFNKRSYPRTRRMRRQNLYFFLGPPGTHCCFFMSFRLWITINYCFIRSGISNASKLHLLPKHPRVKLTGKREANSELASPKREIKFWSRRREVLWLTPWEKVETSYCFNGWIWVTSWWTLVYTIFIPAIVSSFPSIILMITGGIPWESWCRLCELWYRKKTLPTTDKSFVEMARYYIRPWGFTWVSTLKP